MNRRDLIKAGIGLIGFAGFTDKSIAASKPTSSPKQKWIQMFNEMVIKKDISMVPKFYHPDFLLVSNGEEEDYTSFLSGHERIYKTKLDYSICYDESSWVESDSRIGVRMWIATVNGNENPQEVEVIFLAQYMDGLIYRVWELTWPDWSDLKPFKIYNK